MRQFRRRHRRQDTDHHQSHLHLRRNLPALLPGGVQTGLKAAQRRTPQVLRMIIEFDIEARQFRHHHGIVQTRQKGFVHRCRMRIGIDQPGLQLESTHSVARGKCIIPEPLTQQRSLPAQ